MVKLQYQIRCTCQRKVERGGEGLRGQSKRRDVKMKG